VVDLAEAGILKTLFEAMPVGMQGIKPQLTQNELVIEFTEDQLREMLLKNADERAKQSVTLQLLDKKLVIKIRLF
jgi:hypothetical protein